MMHSDSRRFLLVATVIGLIVALLLSGCGGSNTQQQSTEVKVVYPIAGDPRSLNPNWQADPESWFPAGGIFSSLVVVDFGVTTGMPPYGDLAENWDVSPDGKTYTFHLRKNAKWHDGKPVTSADVKYTYDTIIQKKYPLYGYLSQVKSITTPDEQTVVLELAEPNAAFVPMLAQGSTWYGKILPKHIYEGTDWDTSPANAKPIGSGPFKFKEWVRGSHVTVVKNSDYFRGAPAADTVIYKIASDNSVAYAEFRNKVYPCLPADFAPPWAEVKKLKEGSDPDVEVHLLTSLYDRSLYLNVRRAPLNDLKVRQAIALAVDREGLNQQAFLGLQVPSYYAGVPGFPKFLNKNVVFPKHDKAAAEKLLDEAGYPRGKDGWRFKLSVTNPVYAESVLTAEVVVEQLRAVGIDAKWEQFDSATWMQRMGEGNFDISVYFVRYGPDPDAYREHFGSGEPRNFMGYSNPDLDNLLLAARREVDENKRKEMYSEVQTILVRDVPYITLYNDIKANLIRKGWEGFPEQKSGFGKSITWFGLYAVKPPAK